MQFQASIDQFHYVRLSKGVGLMQFDGTATSRNGRISVYNATGYFEKNDLDAYSVNNLTGKPNADGSFTIQFGGNASGALNYLPITPGWNYTVRLYRPRKEDSRRPVEVPWSNPQPIVHLSNRYGSHPIHDRSDSVKKEGYGILVGLSRQSRRSETHATLTIAE